ncbi:MAG: DUF302 domain-containing protein [Sphingomonadales bacterium]|nr:DUF302 domain-containing protein [Sphingomonadales bacterium]
MSYLLKTIVLLFLLVTPAKADESFTQISSPYSVSETMQRLITVVEARGIKAFLHMDHGLNAQNIGQSLRPTEVLMFGSPVIGAPLMRENQQIAIDLPMKVLVYENDQGQVVLYYTNPAMLAQKWGIAADHPSIQKMTRGLAGMTRQAVATE